MKSFRPSDFRILCVEDEPGILRDIVAELHDHGFLVDQASDGREALAQIDRAKPDLIVSDVQMPGLSGAELLKLLRARSDRTAEIPFIFLTAFGDRSSMIEGRRAGADDYLTKPIDYDLLIAVAQSHLVNARRRAANMVRWLPGAGMAEMLPGLADLMAYLGRQPSGTPYALVAVDNLPELVARLAKLDEDFCRRLVARIERRWNVRIFHVHAQKFMIVARAHGVLEHILPTLVCVSVRDCARSGKGRIPITCSIVSDEIHDPTQPDRAVEELRSAVRIVQREGGARNVALHGSDMATLLLANAIRSELVGAIKMGQLSIRLQPKIRLSDGVAIAAEVLVRWESPVLGSLSPATFIPIVERAGLLPHITDLVLREAAICQTELVLRGLPPQLAVNISALEFGLDLPDRLLAVCAEFGADPSLIEVEITETALMRDVVKAGEVVDSLRRRGIRVALDDFGTGYSSYEYLRRLRLDTLKIDRCFVEHLAEDASEQQIVSSMIGLAHALGMDVVAEGVETAEQRAWLLKNGCEMMQGYLVAKPMMAGKYYDFLAKNVKSQTQMFTNYVDVQQSLL